MNFKIRFYDSYGSPSNVYELSVETVTTTQSETTSSSTATHVKSTTSAKIKTTKTPDKETTNKKTTVKTVLNTTDAANNTSVSEIKTTKKKQKTSLLQLQAAISATLRRKYRLSQAQFFPLSVLLCGQVQCLYMLWVVCS